MYNDIYMESLGKAFESLEKRTNRSAWDRGVTMYARELLGDVVDLIAGGYASIPQTRAEFERVAMNGAASWADYSAGGCALVYDSDIAARLCAPYELKKTRDGEKDPNPRETWIDVQTRALSQAAGRAWKAVRAAAEC